MEKSRKNLSRIITVRLLLAVVAAFVVSSAVSYFALCVVCVNNARELLEYQNLALSLDIRSGAESQISNNVASMLNEIYIKGSGDEGAREFLKNSKYSYIADSDGVIIISGKEEFLGKNVNDIDRITGLIDYLRGYVDKSVIYVPTPCPVTTLDGEMELYYFIFLDPALPDRIFLMAYSESDIIGNAEYYAGQATVNRNVGMTGREIAINSDRVVVTRRESVFGTAFPVPEILDRFDEGTDSSIRVDSMTFGLGENKVDKDYRIMTDKAVIWDEECFFTLTDINGVYILSMYPTAEAMSQANETILMIIAIEVVVFAVLFVVLRLLIKRKIVNSLRSVNDSLGEIANGNLNERVEVRDSYEFNTLSNDINATVDRLKEYIAEAAARIDADLAVAKAIQISALPSVFPPFPEHKEFELYASMNAAKEVGGDFYDFYMLGESTLGFLIADVSGKSIPGAMFMMTSKTVIKSLAESGLPPAEVFTRANEKLCEGNEAEMFVTAWLGYLDLKTGLVRVANAGHNPPVLIRDGKAEYVVLKPGLMLAGMEGVRYKEQTLQLQKGDILYLYTDGVTEAMDKDEEQYGEERLKKLLSFGNNYPTPSAENGIVEPECAMVVADVAKFTNGAEQSDDITMLCIRYTGGD